MLLPSERLQTLRHMPIVRISQETADDLHYHHDTYRIYEYRHLNIVDPVEGEWGCNLRAMARYVIDEEAV